MATHTHTQLIYHIVFSTKYREPTIEKDQKKRLKEDILACRGSSTRLGGLGFLILGFSCLR